MPSVLHFPLLLLLVLNQSAHGEQGCAGYDCLKAYVDSPDSVYSWHDTGHRIIVSDPLQLTGWTGYVLNFTSQQWLTSEETSRSVWWHTLVVVVPDRLEHNDTTILWITDGHNEDDFIPDLTDYNMLVAADLAVSVGTVTACLYQVPNQPIIYTSDPDQVPRSEDDNLSYTWRTFYDDPVSNPEVILLLPMTKAAARAMDTVQNFFMSDLLNVDFYPEHFGVGGGSKRGWTTWLVGAVDPRVMAIVPVVMDELNFKENIRHHFRAYGGWSFALQDYWHKNLTLLFDEPKMQDLFNIIDPFAFSDKLLLPKLVCNTVGDEFFLPDNTRYWWNMMPQYQEMNRFLTLPNAEHFTVTAIVELLPAASTWVREILSAHETLKSRHGGKRPVVNTIEDRNRASEELMGVSQVPRFNWTIHKVSGDILVQAEEEPLSVHMWHATTCNQERRDFRLINLDDPCECGIHVDGLPFGASCINLSVNWIPTRLEETYPGSRTWLAHINPDPRGLWTAFFVDLQFSGPSPHPTRKGKGWPVGYDGTFEFTTSVSVVPETFPAENCEGLDCLGILV